MQIQNKIDAIRLLFRKDKALYRSFFDILGFYPRQIKYYQEAVMHKSLAARSKMGRPINNERLEYLGDAVLETVVSDILFHHFPNKHEGFLTNARSKMVQRETLGKVATNIGLDKLIRHHNAWQGHNSYLAGNAFEAIMGAIYLDRGYAYCQRFIEEKVVGATLNLEKTAYLDVNYKSRLLEYCQKHHLQLEYSLIKETRDTEGAPYFHSAVLIEGRELGRGQGYSKRESQQQASKAAMREFKKHPEKANELKRIIEKEQRDASDAVKTATATRTNKTNA